MQIIVYIAAFLCNKKELSHLYNWISFDSAATKESVLTAFWNENALYCSYKHENLV